MNLFYRHGDVDIIQTDKLPDGAVLLDTLTVAYGEITGHHHSFVTDKKDIVRLYEKDGKKYIHVIGEEATITHQEHAPLKIKQGIYFVETEREFDPFKEAIQAVRD